MSLKPIKISWSDLGVRFGLKWVFKKQSGTIDSGSHVVVKGENGSGKSTFGKVLVGAIDSSDGKISWSTAEGKIDIDDVPQQIAWSAPFMEFPEDMMVEEVLDFHRSFRNAWEEAGLHALLSSSGLSGLRKSRVKTLSSGQKQRLRLILAMGTEAGLVILDEPCSNLDSNGITWYGEELKKLVSKTTVVVCSNNRAEEYLSSAVEILLPSPRVS